MTAPGRPRTQRTAYPRIACILALLLLCAGPTLRAQVESGAVRADSTASKDSTVAAAPIPATTDGDSLHAPTPSAAQASARTAAPASVMEMRADSLRLFPYHHANDVLIALPGLSLVELGSFIQPALPRRDGSTQFQAAVTVDGQAAANPVSGRAFIEGYFPTDIEAVRVYPAHQAFYYGGPGVLLAADVQERSYDTPHPLTLLRYAQAEHDYTSVGVTFAMNPGARDNLQFSVLRQVIGTANANEAARYQNTLAEMWGFRVRYRRALGDVLSAGLSLSLHDVLAKHNGGVAGTLDPATGHMVYPDREDAAFLDTAFDPLSAPLVNPTMESDVRRTTAEASLTGRWAGDSSSASTLRVAWLGGYRKFTDNLQSVLTDSIAYGTINTTDDWTQLRAVFDHRTALSFAMLTVRGEAAPYRVRSGGGGIDDAGVNLTGAGRLDLMAGALRMAGFARFDRLYGSAALGIGGTVEGDLAARATWWAGAALTPRSATLLESAYTSPRTVVTGDRDAPLEKSTVVESGLRLAAGAWLDLDLRGRWRRTTGALSLTTAAHDDSTIGRYRLSIVHSDGTVDVPGLSLSLRMRAGGIHADAQAAWNGWIVSGGGAPARTSPALQGLLDLYYRGALIAGTLDVKAGARASASTEYDVDVYNPETDLFAAAPAAERSGPASVSSFARLDFFIYATIRQRATIQVGVTNVLDMRFITAQYHPMDERSFRIGVEWMLFD